MRALRSAPGDLVLFCLTLTYMEVAIVVEVAFVLVNQPVLMDERLPFRVGHRQTFPSSDTPAANRR